MINKTILLNSIDKYIKKIALKYCTYDLTLLDDFVQEGRVGALKALETYQVSEGVFTNHAAWYIKNEMIALSRNLSSILSIKDKDNVLFSSKGWRLLENPIEKNINSFVSNSKVSKERVLSFIKAVKNSHEIVDWNELRSDTELLDKVMSADECQKLNEVVSCLSPKQKELIEFLLKDEEYSVADWAKTHNISKQAGHLYWKAAKENLRKLLA